MTSRASQLSVLEPVLFDIFVSDMKEMTECTFVKFAGDTAARGPAICSRAGLPIQRDLDRPEQ